MFVSDGCVDESPVGQVMDDDSTNVATEIAPTSRTLTGDLCIVIDDVKLPVSDPHESIAEAAVSPSFLMILQCIDRAFMKIYTVLRAPQNTRH